MYAQLEIIKSHIIDVINAAPSGAFSPNIAAGDDGDKRRSQGAVDSVAVQGCRKVIEAVASNPSHGFFPHLAELIPHTNNSVIAAHYGEIGIPLIRPVQSLNGQNVPFMVGVPKDRDEVEGVLYGFGKNPTDFYGFDTAGAGEDAYTAHLGSEGRYPPNLNWYSTANGVITFSGYACLIPMVAFPLKEGGDPDPIAESAFVTTHVPVTMIATAVRYAASLLPKEGDNAIPILAMLGQEARVDLAEIRGGAVQVRPFDPSRIVEMAQKYRL
jgi:hypothetical protein